MNKYYLPARFFALIIFLFISGCSQGEDPIDDSQSHIDGEVESIALSTEEIQELGLQTRTASPGVLELVSSFPGEVMVNQDRFTHIVPRVKGIVESVSFSEGDRVSAGDVLAVLDSRELADIKSEYLASVERADIARLTHEREQRLFDQGISSESEFLQARRDVTEAQIELRSATQKLLSLGFTEGYIKDLSSQPDHALVHYELVAPMSGLVLERHITQGESVSDDTDAFAVADLSEVWIDLDIFQEQLDLVREGQSVRISSSGNRLSADGKIKFVRSIIGEETRTAVARIVLNNHDGSWRPGMFVNGVVTVDEASVEVLVEHSAVIESDGSAVIFVKNDHGFSPQIVETGRRNHTYIEILHGLAAEQEYVSIGAFSLKAELAKSELSDDH